MVQKHVVVTPSDDGGLVLHPLKEWLRNHPQEMPPGMDPTQSTSHELRRGLLRGGWSRLETETEYRLYPPGAQSEPEAEGPAGETEATSDEAPYFSLEYQLRDFLAGNLGVVPVNGRRLRVFVDQTGRDGVEYPSAVGPIDILAVDDEGSFYVFELKRATSPDRAIGQLARYMGWVKETIGRRRDVQGVIVAKAISENLRWASVVVPNVHLFEYEVAFTLNPADGQPSVSEPHREP